MKENSSGWSCMVGASLHSQHVHISCWAPAVAAWAHSSRPLLSTRGQCVTGITRVGTSSSVTLCLSWALAPLHTRRRKQVSLLDSQPGVNAGSFLKSVSSLNPLEVSMTLSTGYISRVVTEGNKHANSCALICEKYLASKCLSYFLGSLNINCLRDFWAVDRLRRPWVNITKREKHPLLVLCCCVCWLLQEDWGLLAPGQWWKVEDWSMILGWECCVPVSGLVGTYPVPFQEEEWDWGLVQPWLAEAGEMVVRAESRNRFSTLKAVVNPWPKHYFLQGSEE